MACECGCGEETRPYTRSNKRRGEVRGQPRRFVRGHSARGGQRHAKATRYVEEDRGHVTPCWIWQLKIADNGYGRTCIDYKERPAHHVYYEERYGPIPEGLVLDHLCRVPACVNPDHLEAVPQLVNVERGENAKLSFGDVRLIRALAPLGFFQRELADLFGVSRPTISVLLSGKAWKVVPDGA